MHYGQEIFEGLKAYRRKDGGINLFRPDQNAKRMANSAKRLLMKPYPEDEFIKAVKEVVLANQDFVPPYGSSSTLYLRPFMIGTQPIVGVSPSETYQFRIYATPMHFTLILKNINTLMNSVVPTFMALLRMVNSQHQNQT